MKQESSLGQVNTAQQMRTGNEQASEQAIALEIADSATRIGVYLETAAGPRRRYRRFDTPPAPEEALLVIHDLILRTLYQLAPTDALPHTNLPPLPIGVALWGHLNRDTGIVLQLRQNHHWQDFPLADRLAAFTGVPVTLETAINAAAWGEAKRGGMGTNTHLYVHLGQEVSASIIQDGQLLIRHSQREEQFGHTTVVAAGPRCQCGGYGHLTPIASAQSLVRTMIGRASDVDESLARVLEISGGRAEALTAPQVVQLATAGDAIARDILNEALDALALAIGNATMLLEPDSIVIGGPLVAAGESFLALLRLRLEALLGRAAATPVLRMGTLEPFASLIGAYALAEHSEHNTSDP